MKDSVIKCLCEILQAYSLKDEWTPELEAEIITKAKTKTKENLITIIDEYNPSGILTQLGINYNFDYYAHLRSRWTTNVTIRYAIIKKYNL